jgi:hypothetical protein
MYSVLYHLSEQCASYFVRYIQCVQYRLAQIVHDGRNFLVPIEELNHPMPRPLISVPNKSIAAHKLCALKKLDILLMHVV